MRKKLISILLCTIIFSNTIYLNRSNAFVPALLAPLVSVSPVVIETIGVGLVSAGFIYNDINEMAKAIKWVYNDIGPEVKEGLQRAIDTSVNGTIKVSTDLYNGLMSSINKLFTKSNEGSLYADFAINKEYPIYKVNSGADMIPNISLPSNLYISTSSWSYLGSGYVTSFGIYTMSDNKWYLKYRNADGTEHIYHNTGYKALTDFTFKITSNGQLIVGGVVTNTYICKSYSSPDNQTFTNNGEIEIINHNFDNSISSDEVQSKFNEGIKVPTNMNDLVSVGQSGVLNPSYSSTWEYGKSVTVPATDHIGVDITLPEVNTDNPSDTNPPGTNPPLDWSLPTSASLDFTPLMVAGSTFTNKFPFSLAWDLSRIVKIFDVEPKAPKFTFDLSSIKTAKQGTGLTIDLTMFNEWANIGRWFLLLGYIVTLILISRNIIGG